MIQNLIILKQFFTLLSTLSSSNRLSGMFDNRNQQIPHAKTTKSTHDAVIQPLKKKIIKNSNYNLLRELYILTYLVT